MIAGITQDGILWRTLPCPIQLAETTVRVFDQHGEVITTVPCNGTGEISRFKAYGNWTTCQWC
jgi:hypothetical protein